MCSNNTLILVTTEEIAEVLQRGLLQILIKNNNFASLLWVTSQVFHYEERTSVQGFAVENVW